MQTWIQPALRQRQKAAESNGIGGAVNTTDSTLVTLVRAKETAHTGYTQSTPLGKLILRGTVYTFPISGY